MIAQSPLDARRDAARAIGIEIANVALGVSAPVLLKLAVDALTNQSTPFALVMFFVLGFVIAWTGTNATTALKHIFTMRIIDKIARRIVLDAARAQLPVLARKHEGDSARLQGVMERLPFSLQIVIDALLWRAAPLIAQTLISLVIVGMLVPPRYMAMLAIVLAAYLVVTRHGASGFQEAARGANDALAAQAQTLGDILRNARRVVFNGNLIAELDTIGARISERRNANERVSRLIAATATLQSAVLAAGLSVLLIFGAADVSAGRLTVGDFVLLQAYAFRLALPLGGFCYVIRQAGVSIVNICEALELGAETCAESYNTLIAPIGPAAISLDDVGFRYGEDCVLRGASADIAPGAFVVLVGPNGSGKSTLAQIIAGLIEPDEGAVHINGRPLCDVMSDERHRLVLYTPQSIGLLNRTLRENALYPPTLASEAELAAFAAWRADAPNGETYDRLARQWEQSSFLANTGLGRDRDPGLPDPVQPDAGEFVAGNRLDDRGARNHHPDHRLCGVHFLLPVIDQDFVRAHRLLGAAAMGDDSLSLECLADPGLRQHFRLPAA